MAKPWEKKEEEGKYNSSKNCYQYENPETGAKAEFKIDDHRLRELTGEVLKEKIISLGRAMTGQTTSS